MLAFQLTPLTPNLLLPTCDQVGGTIVSSTSAGGRIPQHPEQLLKTAPLHQALLRKASYPGAAYIRELPVLAQPAALLLSSSPLQ
jgi:hypothetical protein